MLTHLQLRDFVIVEQAELDFAAGLTALTGETGAGKSIVVDALSMLAGGRAGADVIRAGAERAEATGLFTALPPPAAAWLEAQSIAHEDEVLLRRVVGQDGRSRAYVNGQLVPVQALRELGESLLEIHGQQEFQHLVRREAQRGMLDRHGGLEALAAAVARIHANYRGCHRQVEVLEAALINRESRLELLRHEHAELGAELGPRAAIPALAAIEELFLERKRIAGRGKLAEAARTALAALREGHGDDMGRGASDGELARDNAERLLAKSQAALRSAGDTDPELAAVGSLIAEAAIQVGEAADMLRRFLDLLDVDPARQEDIERRAAATPGRDRSGTLEPGSCPYELRRGTAATHGTRDRVPSRRRPLERGPPDRSGRLGCPDHDADAIARHGGGRVQGPGHAGRRRTGRPWPRCDRVPRQR